MRMSDIVSDTLAREELANQEYIRMSQTAIIEPERNGNRVCEQPVKIDENPVNVASRLNNQFIYGSR